MENKYVILVFLFIGVSTVFVQATPPNECNIATCDTEPRDSSVYLHEFKIVQIVSIQSGYEHDDNQTATIKGKLELVRGAGGSCASSFLVTNATIQFQNVSQTFTSLEEQFNLLERPLVLDGPTVFSSNSSQQDDDDENVNKICVPKGEDVWKTNLRRSLVFMLTANLKAYNDLGEMESFPVILDGSDYVGNDIFGPTNKDRVTNYIRWDPASSQANSFAKLRVASYSHQEGLSPNLQIVSQEITSQFQNSSVVKELKSNDVDQNYDELYETWLSKLETYSNFGLVGCLQSIQNGQVQNAKCTEYQRQATQSFLAVDISTHSEIKLIPALVRDPKKPINWNPDSVQLEKVSMEFDPSSHGPSKDPEVSQGFQKLVSEICDHTETPKEILNFGDRFQRIVPHVSVKVMRDAYNSFSGKCGRSAFLDQVVSSPPSDDVVEFMVDLITTEDKAVNGKIFSNFLWTATMMPTFENDDFQRYATSRTSIALQKLLNIEKLYHRKYEMTDSSFLLHMSAVLNKETKLTLDNADYEEVYPRVQFTLELAKFITALEQKDGSNIDRGTHLSIRRAMEKHGQQLDPDDDTELENDYERLTTHNPCSKKHLSFLENLFEDDKKPEDLKIMAYLFMRKCYIPEWRTLVKEYVAAEEANKDVVNFIVQHIEAISESYKSYQVSSDDEAVVGTGNPSGENVNSSMGLSKFYTMDTDPRLYGHVEVRKAQTGVEVNVVYGKNYIPILVSVELRTFGNDGEQTALELELLRLESNETGNSEVVLTYYGNRMALYTTTITFDQGKLIQLLQNVNESALFEFIRSFSIKNPKVLSELLQNKKLEVFNRPLLQRMHRSFPSISGLPVIINNKLDMLFAFNFTTHLENNRDGDVTYTFKLNPSYSFQGKEEISMGLNHGEILGYQLNIESSFYRNFELILSRSRNGVYKAKLGLVPKHSEGEFFEFGSFDLWKLENFQVLDTKIHKSGHIWSKSNDEEVLDLGGLSDLLKGRVCKSPREIQGIFGRGPIYVSGSIACDLPSALVFEAAPKFTASEVSLDVRIYPEDGKQLENNPQYGWTINVKKNSEPSLNFIDLHVSLTTPSKHNYLNVTLRNDDPMQDSQPLERSLLVDYKNDNGLYGFEVYTKKWKSSEHHSLEEMSQYGKQEFAVLAWSPVPGQEIPPDVQILVGEILFEENKVHYLLKSKGIRQYLDWELEFSKSKEIKEAVDIPISGVNYLVPAAIYTNWTLVVDIDVFGKTEFKGHSFLFESPVPNESRSRLNGVFEVKWAHKWNVIAGEYYMSAKNEESTEDDDDKRPGWVLFKKIVVEGDVRFPDANYLPGSPVLDFKFLSKFHSLFSDFSNTSCRRYDFNYLGEVNPKKLSQDPMRVSWRGYHDLNKDRSGGDEDEGCDVINVFKTDVNLPIIRKFRYHTTQKNEQSSKVKLLEIQVSNNVSNLFGFVPSTYAEILYKVDETEDALPKPRLQIKALYGKTKDQLIVGMEHELIQQPDATSDYDGYFVIALPHIEEQKWIVTGVLEPALLGFNMTIEQIKGKREEASKYTLIMSEIPDETCRENLKIVLAGKDPIVESSVKLLKLESPEGYMIIAKSAWKGMYNLRADLGTGVLHFILELPEEESKFQGKLNWPAHLIFEDEMGTDFILSFKLDGTDQASGKSFVHLSSISDFKWINDTESMLSYKEQSPVGMILPRNFLVTSKFASSIFEHPHISLDMLYQLYPHEEPGRPVLSIAVSDAGRTHDYSLKLNAQYLHSDGDANYTFGEWWTLELPTRQPFTLSSVWTFNPEINEVGRRVGARDVLFELDTNLKHELKMVHHGFFCPHWDTVFSSTTGLRNKGTYWAVYDGDEPSPKFRDVVFGNTTTFLGFTTNFKAEGAQSLPEQNISADIIRVEYDNNTDVTYSAHHSMFGGRIDDLKISHNVTLHEEDPTRYLYKDENTDEEDSQPIFCLPSVSGQPVHCVFSEMPPIGSIIRDFVDYHGLNHKTRRIGWSWETKLDRLVEDMEDDGFEDDVTMSEGQHEFDMFFENWQNFELNAKHDVKSSIFGDYSWKDKLYSKFVPSNSEGNCGLSSSKLFSISTKTKSDSLETLADILYPMLRSKANVTYQSTQPTPADPFQHKKLSLKCVSVILDDDIVVEADCGTFIEENGAEYKTRVSFALPLPRYESCIYTSHVKQSKGIAGQNFVNFVTHKSTLTYPGSYTNKLEYNSTSTILYDGVSEPDNPALLHYDYSAKMYRALDAGGEPNFLRRLVSGSFTSGAGPQQQFLRLLKENDAHFADGSSTEIMDKFIFRLGRVLPGSEFDELCHGDKTLSNIEDISKLYKSELHCQGECHAPEDGCKDAVGRFLAHSAIREDGLLSNRCFTQAVWQDDGSCSARRFSDGKYTNGTAPNQLCTSVLKELGGCWAGLKDTKCNKMGMSKGVKLWRRVVGNMSPMKISRSADTLFFSWVWMMYM